MPDEGWEYLLPGSTGDWIRVEFYRERNTIVHFVVQYEAMIDGKRVPVVRYDDAHGQPHKDVMRRRGREVVKEWLNMDNIRRR